MLISKYVDPLPYIVHESPKLKKRVCNGCLHLEVLVRRRNRKETECYYCLPVKHGYFDPMRVKQCPHAVYDAEAICKEPKGKGIRGRGK